MILGFIGITFASRMSASLIAVFIAMRKLLIAFATVFMVGALSAQPTPRTQLTPAASTLSPGGRTGSTPQSERQQASSRERHRADVGSAQRTTRATAQDNASPAPVLPRLPQTLPYNPQNMPRTTGTTARGVGTSPHKAAKLQDPVQVNWMTLEQALEKNKTEKRKIFVDVFTDWCGWCKRMDSTTFVDPAVARYLNEHYYPVKFNAEQQEDILFKDKTYHFKRTGARGYHELAAEWLNNRLSYPTVVFLDENAALIQPVPNYQEPYKMETIINYFGSDSHRKTPWESFERNFVRVSKE